MVCHASDVKATFAAVTKYTVQQLMREYYDLLQPVLPGQYGCHPPGSR